MVPADAILRALAGGPLRIRVLGHVALDDGGEHVALHGVRQQALLLRLLLADGGSVGPWQLRHDVWEGRQKSDAALRVAVSRLRTVLADHGAPDAIGHTSDGYRLDRRHVDVDADRFVDLVGAAHGTAEQDPRSVVDVLAEALSLWRGPAFGELRDAPFLLPEAERLTSLRLDAVEMRLSALVTLGVDGLVPDLEAAVADAPLRERRTALLMVALYRGGRQVEALAAYRRLETALREDLGLSPSTELRRLEHRILDHDPALAAGERLVRTTSIAGTDGVNAALGRARSARALARAGVVEESLRMSADAVAAARTLDERTLAHCLVAAAQTSALAGQAGDAVLALDEAVVLARRVQDGQLLATAAIVRFGFGLSDRDDLLALLAEPLELLPLDAPERIELLCAAMHQVALRTSAAAAARLLAQAEALASTVDDRRSQALVLAGRAVLAGVQGTDPGRVRELADDALAAAEASGDPTLVVAALHSAFRSRLEHGDLAGLQAAATKLETVATASLFPFAVVRQGLLDVCLRLARGELSGLEERLCEVEATGRAIGVVSSPSTTRTQRGLLALERGQFAALGRQAAALAADGPAWRAVVALCLAETGEVTEAVERAGELVDLGVDGFGELSADERGIATMLAAEVAVDGGDADLARRAAACLADRRGRFIVVAHATITLGPTDRLLGLLALTAGDPDGAVADLRAAVTLAAQAPLWRARSEVGLARALRARNGPGDAAEAARLLAGVGASSLADPWRGGSAWLAGQLQRAERS
jgi:DNA-binding SARP family transcriptional activator